MAKMILLFLVALIGISLRFLVTGIFEPSQLKLAFIFLLAAPLFPWLSLRFKARDAHYTPTDSIGDWTTSLRDKWLTGEKKIYLGEKLIATYHRVYEKKSHKLVADLMESAGLWFLTLNFHFENGRSFTVTSQENWKGKSSYTIWENNVQVAEVRSDLKLEHIKKLREHTLLEVDDHVYEFRASTVQSGIELLKDGKMIGEVERDMKGVQSLNFDSSEVSDENEPLLLINWILFTYRYNK